MSTTYIIEIHAPGKTDPAIRFESATPIHLSAGDEIAVGSGTDNYTSKDMVYLDESVNLKEGQRCVIDSIIHLLIQQDKHLHHTSVIRTKIV